MELNTVFLAKMHTLLRLRPLNRPIQKVLLGAATVFVSHSNDAEQPDCKSVEPNKMGTDIFGCPTLSELVTVTIHPYTDGRGCWVKCLTLPESHSCL